VPVGNPTAVKRRHSRHRAQSGEHALALRHDDGGPLPIKSQWATLLNGMGPVLFQGPYCGVGPSRLIQLKYSKSFPIINVALIWKNTNSILLDLQNIRKKFKFPTEFELKISEAKQSCIWFEFCRSSNLLGKIP
jgi:hypothetical protein